MLWNFLLSSRVSGAPALLVQLATFERLQQPRLLAVALLTSCSRCCAHCTRLMRYDVCASQLLPLLPLLCNILQAVCGVIFQGCPLSRYFPSDVQQRPCDPQTWRLTDELHTSFSRSVLRSQCAFSTCCLCTAVAVLVARCSAIYYDFRYCIWKQLNVMLGADICSSKINDVGLSVLMLTCCIGSCTLRAAALRYAVHCRSTGHFEQWLFVSHTPDPGAPAPPDPLVMR